MDGWVDGLDGWMDGWISGLYRTAPYHYHYSMTAGERLEDGKNPQVCKDI
jgi:hypothetical protein